MAAPLRAWVPPLPQCQPGDKEGAMGLRRNPAPTAERPAPLLPIPVGVTETRIQHAAWVARCVGRGKSAPLRPADVTALASMLAVRAFPPASVLFAGGDQTTGVWIVREGQIELSVGSGRRRVVVQLLRPGDADGDIQLLLEMPLPLHRPRPVRRHVPVPCPRRLRAVAGHPPGDRPAVAVQRGPAAGGKPGPCPRAARRVAGRAGLQTAGRRVRGPAG